MNPRHLCLTALAGATLTATAAFALVSQEPEMPQPTSEHAFLMKRVGTWDTAIEMWAAPGDPMTSTGTEVNTALGSFHLLTEFESDMMGMPFQGHGISSWDPSPELRSR
jgi:hypothetical protein